MAEAILSCAGLTKRFGALTVSDDVSMDLREGEIHALIGPNGAGKSTLVGQLCGAIRPDAGRVRLSGRDVTALTVPARARLGLARTFQVSRLAGQDTVLENALLGAVGAAGAGFGLRRRRDLEARARAALDRIGLADHAGLRADDLSHGQRRRLEIAAALTLDPCAFVMDEPMAGLGPEGSAELTRLLDGLRAEAPILLVEHDMDAVFALADRISVLVGGRIVATGTVAEIRADRAVRAAYLGEAP